MDILIFAGVVMALTQVVKIASGVTKRYIPLVALMIGAMLYTLAITSGAVTFSYESIIEALVSVLTALGVYSGAKATAGL